MSYQQGYPPPYEQYPGQQNPYPGQPQAGQTPYPNYNTNSYPNAGQQPYPSQPPGPPPVIPRAYESGDGGVNVGPSFNSPGFSEKSVRNAFIRKVYLILTAQLLVTCAFIAAFTLIPSLKNWVQHNRWFYYVSYAVFLVTYIALVCCDNVRRRFPGNFIALGIFTLAFSYMTGMIASFYTIESVLIAAGMTAVICLAISIFAIQTKYDVTTCSTILLVFGVVVLLTGIACTVAALVNSPAFRVLYCVYAGLAALLFGMYLAFDTQMIMGGRKHELSPEEYIYGALQLYLDIVNIFILLLSLFGSRD